MAPDKPILIYDGKCGFCRRWVERLQEITGNALDYKPSEGPEDSVILTEPGGKTFRGAEAVFRSLALSPSHRWMSWMYYHLPGAKAVSETLYRLVASHRPFFSALSRFCWDGNVRRPSYFLYSLIFLCGLILIYFISLFF